MKYENELTKRETEKINRSLSYEMNRRYKEVPWKIILRKPDKWILQIGKAYKIIKIHYSLKNEGKCPQCGRKGHREALLFWNGIDRSCIDVSYHWNIEEHFHDCPNYKAIAGLNKIFAEVFR